MFIVHWSERKSIILSFSVSILFHYSQLYERHAWLFWKQLVTIQTGRVMESKVEEILLFILFYRNILRYYGVGKGFGVFSYDSHNSISLSLCSQFATEICFMNVTLDWKRNFCGFHLSCNLCERVTLVSTPLLNINVTKIDIDWLIDWYKCAKDWGQDILFPSLEKILFCAIFRIKTRLLFPNFCHNFILV